MIVKTIHYEALRNLGNYENHKLGIDVEIEPGETVEEAIDRARAMVDKGLEQIDQARQDAARARIAAEAERLKKAFERVPQVQRDPAIVEDNPF